MTDLSHKTTRARRALLVTGATIAVFDLGTWLDLNTLWASVLGGLGAGLIVLGRPRK